MSHASLAARYRPQTFAEVTGQETVKAILSRAAAEDKVAPAYLLSGTRGVGKTTIARIFAKALNCVHAPTGEPCNQCEQCRRITMGNHVDVVEIDGASNRGIDDARRLREAIAYAIENHCPGDVIILCGKGHEDYQIIGKTKVHMDEREIVAEILEKRKREK